MSDYAQTDWVDNVTPVDAARMDNIEAGIEAAHNEAHAAQATADAAVPKSLVDAKGDLIVASAADVVGRLAKGTDGHVLTADAAQALGLKWAAAGGGGAVDYENAWAAGTPYTAGDVVLYNGVEYLAVNPSTGQTPPALVAQAQPVIPLVTTLPASPFDGQEVDLTDSLTTPSFVWRFRYVAAAPTNKWHFIGGAPYSIYVAAIEALPATSGAWINPPTIGPSFIAPRAGVYDVICGVTFRPLASGAAFYVGFGIDDWTVDAGSAGVPGMGANIFASGTAGNEIAVGAGQGIRMKYYLSVAAAIPIERRWLRVLPKRVT